MQHERGILEWQRDMTNGDVSSAGAVAFYLDRIARYDKAGPRINSVIELNPDAHEIARSLDRERAAGRVRGPLHGVPILIKDNIDTADRMQTTAGSLALAGSIARRDAHLVTRLRKAGAVILGKTNLSEWANFRGSFSISGWSSRGGQTRNPYDTARSPSGSSSGSGAAVAADFCAAAVGTETDGSIISPAQTNGIVGIKPTLGLVSRSGVIPIAHSQDTAGPMTRSVADALLLLAAMAGPDRRDALTRETARMHPKLRRAVELNIRGMRIGVARDLAGTKPGVLAVFERALQTLRGLGAVLVDPVSLARCRTVGATELSVLHYEFKADLNAYLRGLGKMARVRSMQDVIAFNESRADVVLKHFGHEHMLSAQACGPLTERVYRSALAKNHKLTRNVIDAVIKRHRLDAIAVPSGGPAWMIDAVNGDGYNWDMESTTPAAVAGYPHITVPAGFVEHLPVGLSLFGGAWREPALVRLAMAFEAAAQARVPPRLDDMFVIQPS